MTEPPKRSSDLRTAFGASMEYATTWAASLFGDAKRSTWRFRSLAHRSNQSGVPFLDRLSLERAVALSPKDPRPRVELGTLLFERGDLEGARRAFEGALGCDFKDSGALRGMGTTLHRLGKLDEAAYYYLSYLANEPEDLHVLINLAIVRDQQGEYGRAIRRLREADSLSPDNPLIHQLLGRSLMRAGDLHQARKTLEKAIELSPRDSEAHRFLGLALETLGDTEAAKASFEKAIDCDPASGYAYLNLAQLLNLKPEEHGRTSVLAARAREQFEKGGNRHGVALALWEVGWAEYLLGNWKKSIRASVAALEEEPGIVPIRFNLALALLQQGDVGAAREHYIRALADLEDLSDLRTHGLADLREALKEDPDLEGGAGLLRMLEAKDEEMVSQVLERTGTTRVARRSDH